jgi:hypothetical protein
MQVTSGLVLLNLTFLCTKKIHRVEELVKSSQVRRVGVKKGEKEKKKFFSSVLGTYLAIRIENLNFTSLSSISCHFLHKIKKNSKA